MNSHMLNPDTLVAVCGYAGDANQIKIQMPYLQHHGSPVLVLSPDDAPVTARLLGNPRNTLYQTGGKRAYVGQLSLDRQRDHLKILAARPERFFLVHDSDSICLSPKLPGYLYAEPDVVWSNIVSDEFHPRDEGYPFPRLAFQPPYFLSKESIQKLIEVADTVPGNPRSPFIDWCMMAWSFTAKLAYKAFPDGMSCGTAQDNPNGIRCMSEGVGIHGKIFLHSIKTRDVLIHLAHQRLAFVGRPR